MKQYLVIALGFLLGPLANAQLAVEYRFDATCIPNCIVPASDCVGAGTPAPFFVNTGLIASASNCNLGPGISGAGSNPCGSMNGFATGQPTNPNRARWASNWSLAFDANDYFGISLTANPFTIVYVDSVKWRESISSATTSPVSRQLRTSANAYSSTVWVGSNNATAWVTRRVTSGLPNFTTTLGIRIYGYGGNNIASSLRIDSLKVYVHVISTLPIELTSFTGHAEDAGVELNWTTATETNNDYFTVYRLEDDTTWNEVGRVTGAGNSQSPQTYSLMDENPKSGTNYYKLRQTDTDGECEEFDVIAVEWKPPDKLIAYPNPSDANGPVYLLDGAKDVLVSDAEGRIIPSKLSGKEIRFDGPPGKYYILIVPVYGDPETIKITRQ